MTETHGEKSPASKRLHQRLVIKKVVDLCWQEAGQGDRNIRARAVDISKFGLLVETEKPIRTGSVVSVRAGSMMLGKARVRHCTPRGLNFRIGLHMPDCLLRTF